jgi:RND family efflux transporter MFP subunit
MHMEENGENNLGDQARPYNHTEPPHPAASSSRRAVVVISFLALIFLGLFIFGYHQYAQRKHVVEASAHDAEGSLSAVNVASVRHSPSLSDLTLPGNIAPMTEAYIYARASGYIRQRYADIGDRVRAGQLLAEIEAPELDQQVQQARAALAQAEKQLEQSKADQTDTHARMDLAQVTWNRYRVLAEHGAVSRQEGDQQQTAFRTASASIVSMEARVGSAEENVRASRANLERLETLQGFEKVRAPFSGVITARTFDIGALISGSGGSMGQNVGSGASTGAQGGEMFRIAQIGVLRVLVSVPESDTPSVQTGETTTILVSAFPGREFKGRITRTASAVDVSSRTMLTEIQVNNSNNELLPGMYAQVRLPRKQVVASILIPGGTVMPTAKGLFVAVLEDLQPKGPRVAGSASEQSYPPQAKRVRMQRIQVGRDYGQEVEVISGLDGSEQLVLNPGDEIEDGAIVQPSAADSKKTVSQSPAGAAEGRGAADAESQNQRGRR